MPDTLDEGFTHANTSPGSAGSTTGVPTTPAIGAANGWTDVHGNVANIVTSADGTSNAVNINETAAAFRDGPVVRPTSEGGADQGIPVEDVERFDQALSAAGVEHEIHVYPGAPHSFFDRRAEEHAEASEDAWRRMLGFLDRYSTAS